MKRRKKTSFSFKGLIVLISILIGAGLCTWYFVIRPHTRQSIHLQPLPEGFLSHGIDISHHQGEIDWDVFFEHMDTTISFVYCKVTEGVHFTDPKWKQNHKVLSHHEMKHGGYHFFTPDVSAQLQADHFLNHYAMATCDMPPVLDAEVEASSDQSLINGMREWLKIVELNTGIRPVIYTSYSLYKNKMKEKFPGYEFWIASYNPNEARLMDPAIIHWQYSDCGQVPGIQGLVDLNFSKQAPRPILELAK